MVIFGVVYKKVSKMDGIFGSATAAVEVHAMEISVPLHLIQG